MRIKNAFLVGLAFLSLISQGNQSQLCSELVNLPKKIRQSISQMGGNLLEPQIDFVQSCLCGDLLACVFLERANLEFVYAQNEDVPHLTATHASKILSDCEKEDEFACLAFSIVLKFGMGVPVDLKKSFKFAKRSCELGLGRGCSRVGFYYQEGLGVKVSQEEAADYFGRACAMEDASGCVRLGFLYELGRGVPSSRVAAQAIYQAQCHKGNQTGCVYLQSLGD